MVFVHILSIAFASDVDRFSFADIFQVTCPAASGCNIQNEAVIVGVIRTCACQDEVFYERALVQCELGLCASIVGTKAQCAAVVTAN